MKYVDRVLSVVAVVSWMVLIFWFSAKTAGTSSAMSGGLIEKIAGFFNSEFDTISAVERAEIVERLQWFVLKEAHFSEYAMLVLLVSNALRSFSIKNRVRLLSAPVISLVYAVSDEIHQYFVPGRACRFLDIAIDFGGAVCGAAVFFAAAWLLGKPVRRGRTDDKKADLE